MINNLEQVSELDRLKGQVNKFDQIEDLLPKNLPPKLKPLLQTYFEAQLKIKQHDLLGANNIFNTSLNTDNKFLLLEEENPQLLAAIDVLIRGETSMILDKQKPEFTFKKK